MGGTTYRCSTCKSTLATENEACKPCFRQSEAKRIQQDSEARQKDKENQILKDELAKSQRTIMQAEIYKQTAEINQERARAAEAEKRVLAERNRVLEEERERNEITRDAEKKLLQELEMKSARDRSGIYNSGPFYSKDNSTFL
jgi:septal ring factor EnvC (AmiA/AmiB activator)